MSVIALKPTPERLPKPPAHLKPATAVWCRSVVETYQLEAHHVRLLTLAAEAWDRCTEARLAIAAHGLTYVDKFGSPHQRPEIKIEVDNRAHFARLIRELDLDTEPPSQSPYGRRPPALRSNRPAAVADADVWTATRNRPG